MKIIEQLQKSIRVAAIFNSDVQVAPACILWPDGDRQWKNAILQLVEKLPELFILGEYDPENRSGPAIWLRCVIAEKIDDIVLPRGCTPIFYLPGVSRQDLRAVETCPDYLKPIAELQYRGMIWSQLNTKDWTILAYLKTDQGGLGLDVAQDTDTKNAMLAALDPLLEEDFEKLKEKHLDKEYFNTLITGGDPVRDFLQWLDQGDSYRKKRSENEWKAFIENCKSKLGFNPQKEGILTGVAKLASCEGPWLPIWKRFCEAPKRYSKVPIRLLQCKMPPIELFSDERTHGSWPQWNDDQEKLLRKELKNLEKLPSHEARKRIIELETKHGKRRDLVWAELGEAPLAFSIEHCARLATLTQNSLAAGSIDDLLARYCDFGWQADDALLFALSYVSKIEDVEAAKTAIRSLYIPWAEECAQYLQKKVDESDYPGGSASDETLSKYSEGECVLFIDGLRFDVAKRLKDRLTRKGCKVEEKPVWAALPSVTATGKPAVSPVKDKIHGKDIDADFEPVVAESGKSLKGGYHLKKLMIDSGWEFLDSSSSGQGKGHAWSEICSIDHEGHSKGWKLAKHIDEMLGEIEERILKLFSKGWKSIRVVTDHGWLLVPGGLPKIELPSALTVNKWGRCAVLKPGAMSEAHQYPWYWNPSQYFVSAEGISCFNKGNEYAHGGLSLQECLVLALNITIETQKKIVEFKKIVWKGFRCAISVGGEISRLKVDIRKQPGDQSTSVILSRKLIDDDGKASVLVENEELEGSEAFIVLINEINEIVAQAAIVIGGGKND